MTRSRATGHSNGLGLDHIERVAEQALHVFVDDLTETDTLRGGRAQSLCEPGGGRESEPPESVSE